MSVTLPEFKYCKSTDSRELQRLNISLNEVLEEVSNPPEKSISFRLVSCLNIFSQEFWLLMISAGVVSVIVAVAASHDA